MSNNTPNMLFYSRNCATCDNLLMLLKNENMLSYLKLVCVDDIFDKIPKGITKVPTLILFNATKPLVAGEIFEWVKTVKEFKGIGNYGGKSNLIGYSFSDANFTHVVKDKDAINFQFDTLENKTDFIFTPPEKNDKINKKTLENNINDVLGVRNEQESFFTSIFSNDHKDAVKKYENEIRAVRRQPR
jgi:hypothetical protein